MEGMVIPAGGGRQAPLRAVRREPPPTGGPAGKPPVVRPAGGELPKSHVDPGVGGLRQVGDGGGIVPVPTGLLYRQDFANSRVTLRASPRGGSGGLSLISRAH